MGPRKIYSPISRMRIAVKMEIYLERRIAANPDLPMIQVVEAEYAKYDASPKTFLVKMLLGWDKYGDEEKFSRYLAIVLEQSKHSVTSGYVSGVLEATGVIPEFPICLAYPCLTPKSIGYDDPVATAAAYRYTNELGDLFTDNDEAHDAHWHPDDPTSWDSEDYMNWEIDRLMAKPD